MGWLALSILTALSEAAKDLLSKLGLRRTNVYLVAWAYRIYSLPFLLPILLFIDIPEFSSRYWLALFVGGTLNVFTTILYMKAIEKSDLSLVVPMVTFTPLFLLITSPLIIGELPGFFGVIGVILIVLGSYFLNISKRKDGFFSPFKALLKDKGPRYMLSVAFIWSITSNFDKMGIMESSPIFWAISANLFIAIAMAPMILLKSRLRMSELLTQYKSLLPIGFFGASTLICQMLAIKLTYVAYVISIKRTSAIIVVFAGYLFFKEKNLTSRLLGVTIMVVGVVLISIFS